jgi:hypothetical protein
MFAVLLLSLPPRQDAYAGDKKVTASGKNVAVLAETKMLPGDDPKHEVIMNRQLYEEQTSDPDFKNAQGYRVNVSDLVAGSGSHRGYAAATGPGGDKWFTAYEGRVKTVPKQGAPPEITFEGKWWYVGGTGKFKGITGGGTYKGEVTPAGAVYQYQGEYEIKQ